MASGGAFSREEKCRCTWAFSEYGRYTLDQITPRVTKISGTGTRVPVLGYKGV